MDNGRPQRILVTGSRDWTDRDIIRKVLSWLPPGSTVVHGAARGADTIAAEEAKALGLTVEAHPADWKRHGKAAGPIRNQKMIDAGPYDAVFAFPLPDSIGTRDCIERARKAGYEVAVFPPDFLNGPEPTPDDIAWGLGLPS